MLFRSGFGVNPLADDSGFGSTLVTITVASSDSGSGGVNIFVNMTFSADLKCETTHGKKLVMAELTGAVSWQSSAEKLWAGQISHQKISSIGFGEVREFRVASWIATAIEFRYIAATESPERHA